MTDNTRKNPETSKTDRQGDRAGSKPSQSGSRTGSQSSGRGAQDNSGRDSEGRFTTKASDNRTPRMSGGMGSPAGAQDENDEE